MNLTTIHPDANLSRLLGLQPRRLGVVPVTAFAASQPAKPKPDDILANLMEGNKRFVEGKLEHPGRSPKDFQPLAAGQAPPAIILGCADFRSCAGNPLRPGSWRPVRRPRGR